MSVDPGLLSSAFPVSLGKRTEHLHMGHRQRVDEFSF